MIWKVLLKIIKFIVNNILRFFLYLNATFLFSNTYELDKYEEYIEEIKKPIWK